MGRPKCFEREEVLDKAVQLFWKKGYADTSLSDLEKATGVNKSGLYSEFKDKDDIYLEGLKRYSSTTPMLAILQKAPRGLVNIDTFLRGKIECTGTKGCFFASSMRELNILPARARSIIEQSVTVIREELVANIKAAKLKGNPERLADMIITYNTGLCLKLNAVSSAEAHQEVDSFMEFISP